MKQAKELVEKCKNVVHKRKLSKGGFIPISMYDSQAKQCALICAKEVLKTLGNIEGQQESLYREEQEWIEIKEYLENELQNRI